MHKEIVSKDRPVYDVFKAKRLFEDGLVGWRTLTIWKQENIKEGIEKGLFRTTLKAVKNVCGGCFFTDHTCADCSLQIDSEPCHNSAIYHKFLAALRREEQADASYFHRKWCEEMELTEVYGEAEQEEQKSVSKEPVPEPEFEVCEVFPSEPSDNFYEQYSRHLSYRRAGCSHPFYLICCLSDPDWTGRLKVRGSDGTVVWLTTPQGLRGWEDSNGSVSPIGRDDRKPLNPIAIEFRARKEQVKGGDNESK